MSLECFNFNIRSGVLSVSWAKLNVWVPAELKVVNDVVIPLDWFNCIPIPSWSASLLIDNFEPNNPVVRFIVTSPDNLLVPATSKLPFASIAPVNVETPVTANPVVVVTPITLIPEEAVSNFLYPGA